MTFRRLFAPGLLRDLLARTLIVGVVPLLVLAVVILTVTDRLVYERFQQQSSGDAANLSASIGDRVLLTARYANLIAEIQQTRDAIESGDQAAIRVQLLPLKARLGLDIVNVATPTGTIITGAQDSLPGERIVPALLERINSKVESAWILDGESPRGPTVTAVAPVRGHGIVVGVIETGLILDDRFLAAIHDAAHVGRDRESGDLAIAWDGQVRASTVKGIPGSAFPTVAEIDAAPGRSLARTIEVDGARNYAVFTVVESHQSTLGVLAALLPLAPVDAAHNAILSLTVLLLAALVTAIAILGYRFTTSLTGPLVSLAAAAQAVQAGDLTARIPMTSPHEIGLLERSFDTMIRSLAERDATNRQLLGELERQALFDTLTGLPNRTLLQDRLRQAILNADRQSLGFAIILLDLDRFKDINDTFGHHVGDILLRQVGPQLGEVLRGSDTVSRFGGDEFALLLPTATDAAGAVQAADRVLSALQQPFVAEGLSLQVEASLGIAMYPVHGADAAALLQHADAAMYQAKRSKSGYAMYSVGEEEASRDRLLLLGELREAIEHAQLWLYYQPAVDPSTKRIIGMEALVRWQHPRLGLLSAASFIPFAEQTGLIRPLGEWVLRTAIAQSAHWTRVGIDTPIAVNLSARDLPDPGLPERIAQMLEAVHVPPSRLRLEITESAVMSDPARSLEILGRLRDMGIELSIDDFGTGYSSLTYLRRLPVAEIKIDRSFVTDMLSDPGAAAIVRSTIDLGHNLGLRVIAEGVESEEVTARLASLGCDGIQGYYVSPAMPAELVAGWIGNSQWTLDAVEANEPVRFRPRRTV